MSKSKPPAQQVKRKLRVCVYYYCWAYNSSQGHRWSVGLAHVQSLEDNFVERGISTTRQKPVQLAKVCGGEGAN